MRGSPHHEGERSRFYRENSQKKRGQRGKKGGLRPFQLAFFLHNLGLRALIVGVHSVIVNPVINGGEIAFWESVVHAFLLARFETEEREALKRWRFNR